jgi:predicted nucleotidyltransferase
MTGRRVTLHHRVVSALQGRPAVRSVRLVGSRLRGTAGPLSDWDFAVEVTDFADASAILPNLVAPLQPLVQQWDPLSKHWTYMLILPGPSKVDLLFDEPHEPEPPWIVRPGTLQQIDSHFWDWLYWLASKHLAGKHSTVAAEFAKLSRHLLGPLGVEPVPQSIEQAVSLYSEARQTNEARMGVEVSRNLEHEVRRGLRAVGYEV